jgi:CMP-N-acetylneuraminic acid synthetase
VTKIFAFIFARGGSKGLPGKNIRPLAGKPLINYSIETALQDPSIAKVFVSTDDSDIAQIARESGATIIERPAELATDTSPEWLSWRHAIEYVADIYGTFDIFVSLPATSPLRSAVDIQNAVEQLIASNADICISVTPANRSPYFNMVKINHDDTVSLVIPPKGEVSRRQDAPQVFDITTVVYAAKPSFIMEKSRVFDGRVVAVEIPKHRAVDIDDIYDFKYAESLINGEQDD